MRVTILSIVSTREFGVIVSAHVEEEEEHARAGKNIRVRVGTGAILGRPQAGEIWDVQGELRESPWGPQMEATRAVRIVPTGRLVRDFVAGRVVGMGPERADALWRKFGMEISEVLSDDSRLAEIAAVIAPDRPNLAPRLAAACMRAWQEAASETRTILWLTSRGIDEIRIARRVANILGNEAVAALEANPYVLVPMLPWRRVDELGLKLLAEAGVEVPAIDTRRLVGAVDAAVKEIIASGDTAVSDGTLRGVVGRLLRVTERSDQVDAAIRAGARNQALVMGPSGWRAPGCALMEEQVIDHLRRMLLPEYPNPLGVPCPAHAERFGDEAANESHALTAEQRAAVLKALANPLTCIQGGAGVGKTMATRAVCEAWERLWGRVVLCAVAGKAALRLSRAAGRPAFTVARLLHQLREREMAELDARAGYGDEAQQPWDGASSRLAQLTPETLLIVDEASMLDLASASALLRRLPAGARLLLVGDEAQLPPVGFGLVFHKLVGDEALTARLTHVHRQSQESGIPAVSAAVRTGRLPTLPPYVGRHDGVSILECRAEDIASLVTQTRMQLTDAGAHTMVVTPTNEGDAGVRGLNARLHGLHVGPETGASQLRGPLGQWYAAGEPVVFLRNDYSRGLFNGLLGKVTAVDPDAGSCTVSFDGYDEPHIIGHDDLIDLQLAYAVTCHRAQGSQAETVVIPVYRTRVMERSWLYTAITRAERQIVLVGPRALMEAVLLLPPAAERRQVGMRWPPSPDPRPISLGELSRRA